MNAQHTPGPWNINGENIEIENQTICTGRIGNERHYIDFDNWPANARLIAAAPELLALLKDIAFAIDIQKVQLPKQITDLADTARAAIARATGNETENQIEILTQQADALIKANGRNYDGYITEIETPEQKPSVQEYAEFTADMIKKSYLQTTPHTPEPWRQSTRNPDIVYAGNIRIAKCCADIAYTKEEEANARRIVAAVNACKDIQTETLESAHLNQTIQKLIVQKKELQVQNDRLKKAHQELLGFIANLTKEFTGETEND